MRRRILPASGPSASDRKPARDASRGGSIAAKATVGPWPVSDRIYRICRVINRISFLDGGGRLKCEMRPEAMRK